MDTVSHLKVSELTMIWQPVPAFLYLRRTRHGKDRDMIFILIQNFLNSPNSQSASL